MDHVNLGNHQERRKFLGKQQIKYQQCQPKRKLSLMTFGTPSDLFGTLFSVLVGLFFAYFFVMLSLWFLRG